MGKGRAPCCDKSQVKRGPWSPAEDLRLITFIQKHGHENWRALPKQAGLLRCGKSCRLRWINYLRPDVKRGNFSKEEEDAILHLHQALGNKWSKIASHFPGRTDNEIKNVWNTHLKKRLSANPIRSPTATSSNEDPKQESHQDFSSPRENGDGSKQPLITSSASSTSSSYSNASYDSNNISTSSQPHTSMEDYLLSEFETGFNEGGLSGVGLESDSDFWDMFGIEKTNSSFDSNAVEAEAEAEDVAATAEEEIDVKWLHYIKNELGLTGDAAPLTRDDGVAEDDTFQLDVLWPLL